MTGFVGILNLDGEKIDSGLLLAMSNLIQHRDWYKRDNYMSTSGATGIVRVHLGIIDNGTQPHTINGGKVHILLHGQLYNDELLQMTPVMFVEQCYKKYGEHFPRYLNGSFVCLVIDEARHTVLIATDRLASQPFFYFWANRTLYFSPELKSLLLVPSLARKLNWGAVQDFLAAGHFTSNHTWIENVQKLDNATLLKLTPQGSTEQKYWTYEIAETAKDLGFQVYQEQLADLLLQAVRKRTRTNHRYGILLSGGYDSRGILGCYLEAGNGRDLNTITWGEKEAIPNSDCVIAHRLAQQVGANHQFYERKPEEVIEQYRNSFWLSEGLTSTVSALNVSDHIKEQQGIELLFRGDTCLGRYLEGGHKVCDEYTLFRRMDILAMANIAAYQRILQPSVYQTFCELNQAIRSQLSARCKAKNFHNRHTFFYVDVRVKHLYNALNTTKSIVGEVLVPWLDDDILDFTRTLPLPYRLNKSLYVHTVVKLFPQLFTENAQARNDIQWLAQFRQSPSRQAWVYHELVEQKSILAEFVDMRSLKQELNTIFATPTSVKSLSYITPMKEQARQLLATSPAAYDFIYRLLYSYQKRVGQVEDALAPDQLIWRLLALKTWNEMFLRVQPYPEQSYNLKQAEHTRDHKLDGSCERVAEASQNEVYHAHK